jgi:hypothetical protein
MEKDKKPMFVDLDNWIFGSFVRKIPQTNPDFVKIEYVPLLSFKKYETDAIPDNAIHQVLPKGDDKGIEPEIVMVYQGLKGGAGKFFETAYLEENKRLKSKIKDMQMQLAAAEQEREDAASGTAKAIRMMKQTRKGLGDTSDEEDRKNNRLPGLYDF